MQIFDVIIIGAGAAGSSTALALAKRGQKVLLLEQFSVPHERGSSHGHSRIFRFAYDDPDYARFAMRSLAAWRELEADTGQVVLDLFGGLDLGTSGNESLERTASAMSEVGAAFERLDSSALMQRFPQWNVPTDSVGLFSPDAGIVMPSRAVELMVAQARVLGVTLLEQCEVLSLDVKQNLVRTNQGDFSAAQIVIAAGAWLPKLVPALAPKLEVTLESVMYFAPKDLGLFTPKHFPIFIDHNSLVYGFPVQGLPGVKLGYHQSGAVTNPDTRAFDVPQATIDQARTWLETHLPKQNWSLIQARTCLYTNTPSHDFILDTHPDSSTVLLVSPCSGHGFKFSAYIGELVADKLNSIQNEFDLPRFKLEHALRKGSAKLLSRAILQKEAV
jgi:sarcosine oxidase